MAPGARRVEAAPEGARRAQRWLVYVALLGVAAGTAAGWSVAVREEDDEASRVADALAEQAVSTIEAMTESAVRGLEGGGALVDTSGAIDVDAFHAYGAGIADDLVYGLALGVRIDGDERDEFEADVAPLVRRRPGGAFGPAPEADEYYPIVDIVSTDPDRRRVIGLDYAADPARSAALEAARDGGSAVITEPTPIAIDGRTGFLVIQPLYRRGADLSTVGARRSAYVGFLAAGYSATDVLEMLRDELPPGSVVAVADAGEVLFGEPPDPDDLPRLTRTRAVPLLGREWDVTVVPAEGAERTLSTAIVVAGVAGELGLLLVVFVTYRYQRRLRTAYGLQRQAQQRSSTFEGLASRLSRSLSSMEVAEALLQQLPPFTGTTAGAVLVLDDDGEKLHLLAADGYAIDDVLAFREVDLSHPSAVADAVRSAEPVWLSSPLSWRGDEVTTALGSVGRAVAIVPLVADRRVAGVLVLVHPGVRSFYEDERSSLTTVAALAARALNRAQRYDAEHDAAVVLQRALLPSVLPDLPDVTVAVRYLPATGGLAVGGDWYDVFPVGGGRAAVVVGDVVGRGVKAAAAMGRLRSAIRALAEVLPEPTALLRAFEHHVPTIPDALCATMIYAVVDPAVGALTYVRAGHPPPLLLRPGEEPRLLDAAVSPPLGVTGGAPVQATTIEVRAGDTLLLYTDGVIERRGEPVTVGLERLRQVCRGLGDTDPEASCDRIVDALLGNAGHGDDAAVVALRVVTTRSPEVRASVQPSSTATAPS